MEAKEWRKTGLPLLCIIMDVNRRTKMGRPENGARKREGGVPSAGTGCVQQATDSCCHYMMRQWPPEHHLRLSKKQLDSPVNQHDSSLLVSFTVHPPHCREVGNLGMKLLLTHVSKREVSSQISVSQQQ